jgi:DNA-binding NtrC family response regulator
VESTAGVGTTFRILLPASTKTLGQPSGTAKEPELERGHGELVLLVEDEETVRNIIGSALERKGYRTLRAKNGEDAIVHWQSHKEEINLLLTDIILPGRYTGADLIALFRKDRPKLPILASSGYITTEASQLPTDIFTLPKPYDIRTLLEAVRRILPQQGAKTPPLQAEM